MRLLGYTRVSTSSQEAQLQLDVLVTAGFQKRDVFADVTSGSKTVIARRGMKKLLEHAEPGDTVVVWRVRSGDYGVSGSWSDSTRTMTTPSL